MSSTPLYRTTHHGTSVTLEAERNDEGHLVIAGQDIGGAPSEIFGRDDYEYRYTLDADAERELGIALRHDLGTRADDDMTAEQLLQLAFRRRVLPTATDLRPYLEDHSINFGFSSF